LTGKEEGGEDNQQADCRFNSHTKQLSLVSLVLVYGYNGIMELVHGLLRKVRIFRTPGGHFHQSPPAKIGKKSTLQQISDLLFLPPPRISQS